MMNRIIGAIACIVVLLACESSPEPEVILGDVDEAIAETKECDCGKIEMVGDFKNGLARVDAGDCVYYVNEDAELAIQDTFYSAKDFWGIYAAVQMQGDDKAAYSIIDTSGKVILDIQQNYDNLNVDWEGNYVRFSKGEIGSDKEGVMDLTGKIIIPLQEDDIYIHGDLAMLDKDMKHTTIYDLKSGEKIAEYDGQELGSSEGFVVISNTHEFFYLDSTGQRVFGPYSSWAGEFSEGLAKVCHYGQVGFIDRTGELVIPYQYDLDNFSAVNNVFKDGLCAMSKDDELGEEKIGFIDRTGKMVIPQIYDDADDFENGYAKVELDGKNGLIDTKGNLVMICDFNYFWILGEGLYAAYENGANVIFDNENRKSSITFDMIPDSYNGKVVGVIDGELVSMTLDSLRDNIANNVFDL